MQCTSPRTVGFRADGKTISWSQKTFSKEFATFQLPCGKCIECRLEYARQWAIRCVHEAQMHQENSFITLTYSEKHLESPKLQYRDFQLFMKKLRFAYPNQQIGMFVTGEYGDRTKRPHWHAIVFGWSPKDLVPLRKNEMGDQLYTSASLDRLWGKNDPDRKPNEIGSVTFESAGYVARYAAKKLVHGNDGHEFEPVSKKSNKNAIGKAWLERYWRDVLNAGCVVLPDGATCGIPRYYVKWLIKNQPAEYFEFLLRTKEDQIRRSLKRVARDRELRGTSRVSKHDARREIQKQKFEQLQAHLKLK